MVGSADMSVNMSEDLNSSDRIILRDLRLAGVVGVLPEERVRPQPLSIDIEILTDLTRAGLSDDLDDSVDYGALCDRVADMVHAGAPLLLERLAHLLADDLLAEFPLIDVVVVEVRKLRPPVPHQLGTSGVRIARRRKA